ncbi:outer dynein arm-docking complex subunit 4-like isoform X3 [Amphiura filiformis]|uniref:outer dynein arm-docking complex subunit 4-like isoform X3 n=1 Tax=Amphiura filiformis TaxID=82378 RepID=UPI003B21BD57
MYGNEEDNGALSKQSFPIFMAEGDVLFKQGEYKKALESYSTALEIEPADKNCLVARSKCHLQLGNADEALRDAEASLEEDKEYHKGLYQKAEALYQKGDFEMALVFYHRGNKLRPELQEFRLGIQKAQEAIDNSVGDPSKVRLETKGDLSFFNKQDEKKNKKKAPMGYSKPMTRQQDLKQNKRQKKPEKSDKEKEITKQLLGELYADKVYLDKLLRDEDLTNADTDSGNRIYDLVNQGIEYLDTRTEFWRQQKPMYARKREKDEARGQREKSSKKPHDPAKYVLKNLEEIDAALADGRPKDALKQAQRTMKTVDSWKDDEVQDKNDFVANLNSCIGNAYLDLGDMKKSEDYHKKDLTISKDNNSDDGRSRALDNLGRVYARIGKFDLAVEHWKEKLPLVKSPLEATWLYHEIGRCHLELGNHQEARDFGEKSLEAAREAEDNVWQLNASVLIAQSEVKLGDLQDAIESFERALEMAKVQGDEPAQKAISKALEELNQKIVQGIKDGQIKDEEEDKKDEDKKDEDKKEDDDEEDQYEQTFEEEDETDKEDDKASDTDEGPHTYIVHVKTGSKMTAGTDANVLVTLYGEDGDSGERKLDNNGNNFERNNDDDFKFKAPHLGKLTKVRIGHDNSGAGAAWYLDKVVVVDGSDMAHYEFDCDRWLADDEDDKQIVRELECTKVVTKEES